MTLQEQYNLIKEGKGHKGIFLTEAKKQFPNMLTNPMGFEEASKMLKTRGVISENYIDLKPINTIEASPKSAWENKFAQFLAEEAKAVEKKTTKEVEDIQAHNYDYKDKSNLDNQIGQEVLNGIYFEAKENPDKTLDEIRKIVAKNLAKDGQYYMKNAAFGVKGLGYQETKMEEVSGKYAFSGYSDKLKKVVKESLVKEEITNPLSTSAEDLAEKIMRWYDFNTDYIDDGGQRRNALKRNENVVQWFKKHDAELQAAANQIIKDKGGKSLSEASDFEEKMAQLRMLQMQKKAGAAPNQKVINKKQTLTQKLNMLKKAYFDLISAMEKESDLEFAVSGDWYQEQLDDLENSIGDLESKIQSINENAIGEEVEITAEVEKVEKAEPKVEKKAVKKESLEDKLAEIDTQAGIVAMEAKLDKISEMISTKMERLSMIEEDANLAELVDKGKMKAMQKEIKVLEKAKAKMEKMYEKMNGKAYTKEMVDESSFDNE
jgi:predicted thioesterase